MFRFKQFVVHQDRTAMKVGTDGVLLGAWFVTDAAAPRILDVGTGTGLIALMAAQRYPTAIVDAIDIDREAATQAAENAAASPFANRVVVTKCDLKEFVANAPSNCYDTIVCNPPFFVNSLRCPDNARTAARHTDTLSHHALVECASRLLKECGTINLVLPFSTENPIFSILVEHNFVVERVTNVYSTPSSELPKRLLIAARYQPNGCADNTTKSQSTPITDNLVIEEARHQYTAEYIALTHDFYLKM